MMLMMTKNMINYHQNTTPKYYQETHYKYVKNSGFWLSDCSPLLHYHRPALFRLECGIAHRGAAGALGLVGCIDLTQFIVRKKSGGVGVERTFPMNSPIIESVEAVKRGKARQAKLGYVRKMVKEPKFKERRAKEQK